MKLQAIISSVALVAALSFSGASYAQNMMNGMEIPADQIENFKGKCEALRAEANASLTSDEEPTADATETGAVDPATQTENPDPAAQENWDQALASLTIEQCDEAGFAAAM